MDKIFAVVSSNRWDCKEDGYKWSSHLAMKSFHLWECGAAITVDSPNKIIIEVKYVAR